MDLRIRARLRGALTAPQRRRAAGLAAAVLALHVLGFFLLIALVVPRDLRLGAQGTFGLGLGLTAYTLGLRHAVDADHISAIDNATRKLMADGQRPLSVGFFFSLGHSTIVFLLAFLFALGVRESAGLHQATAVIGPSVSGTLLLAIATLNLLILVNVVAGFRRGELDPEPGNRGVLTRVYGRAIRAVGKPWHLYPVGILFGLGFDTATEIILLFLAAGAAGAGLPFYAILCLPILFAAGMSLLDTIDGAFMNLAYGWALAHPARRAYYNITVTALSVVVASIVGTIELLAVLTHSLRLRGGAWDAVSTVDLNLAGYLIVGAFAVTWAASAAIWRLARIGER